MKRVIKLGGSLLQGQALPACLNAAESLSGVKVLVPGGGVFAEQVRQAQVIHGFDDVSAHAMAILAMRQMALLIKGLKPDYSLLESAEHLAVADGGVAVWSPRLRELDNAGVPASWDVTSDSLAAWLAARIGADELMLVKSANVRSGASLSELRQQGVVDAAFSAFAAKLDCPVTVINKDRFIATL